jgi:hypothetical protein
VEIALIKNYCSLIMDTWSVKTRKLQIESAALLRAGPNSIFLKSFAFTDVSRQLCVSCATLLRCYVVLSFDIIYSSVSRAIQLAHGKHVSQTSNEEHEPAVYLTD